VLGDPEVSQIDVIGIGLVVAALDQQVPRLHVPVHQSLAVRGVEGARGLTDQEQGGGGEDPAALLDHLPHVGPGDVPHRDVQQVVLGAHVVDGDHVRVVERGRDPRFLQEPGPEDIVGGKLGRQHLQCDDTAEAEVLGLVDHAHAAAET